MILQNTELDSMTDHKSKWQIMIGILNQNTDKRMEIIITQLSYHSNVLQTTVTVEQVNLLKWVTPTLAWLMAMTIMEKELEIQIETETLMFEDF